MKKYLSGNRIAKNNDNSKKININIKVNNYNKENNDNNNNDDKNIMIIIIMKEKNIIFKYIMIKKIKKIKMINRK